MFIKSYHIKRTTARLENKGMRRYNVEEMGHLPRFGTEGEREKIMKKKTKDMIVTNIIVFIMAFSFIGCGKDIPTMNEDDSDINSASNNEIVENSEIDDEAVADVISDLPDDVVETIIEDGTVPTSSGLDLLEEDIVESESEPESEPEPHVHQYAESITVQPTCAVAGEKMLTCECGDVLTESVPATGSHNWVEQTTVIHHDELGHVMQETVLVGWTEPHTEYECHFCGHREDTPGALRDHCYNAANGDISHALSRTFAYDYPAEPIYETQSKWVVDQEAYDSVEIVGYQCSVCGATNVVEQPKATGETVPITEMDGSVTNCPVYVDGEGKRYYVYLGYEIYIDD